MQRFVELFLQLDRSNKSKDKVEALVSFFLGAEPAEASWGLFFLSGRKLPALVKSSQLRHWAADAAELPLWLVERCYETAGDLAETLALILPEPDESSVRHVVNASLATLVEGLLLPLQGRDDAAKAEAIRGFWETHSTDERFIFNKLMTGGLRVGVSRATVEKALGQVLDIEPTQVAHRMMGQWEPSVAFWESLATNDAAVDPARPYPFYLASSIEERSVSKDGKQDDIIERLQDLGPIEDWTIEWKWDGIRAQLIRRGTVTLLWSRGEEVLNEGFPEIVEAAQGLPDGTVLDGELLVWGQEGLRPFGDLQKRLGRSQPSSKLLETHPASFVAYDIMEHRGKDIRQDAGSRRRQALRTIIESWEPAVVSQSVGAAQLDFMEALEDRATYHHRALRIVSPLELPDWEAAIDLNRASRDYGVEGFILKRNSAPYQQGRVRGDWWKWKVTPYTIDCVMLNAQAGHGRRAGLYTDFTFGVWDDGQIVPVAKAYSGLSNAEFVEVDRWIKAHTVARRGPIRMVEPELVFEIAFEGIQRSPRHKSGIAFRFPRIARWRTDKTASDANQLEDLERLLASNEGGFKTIE